MIYLKWVDNAVPELVAELLGVVVRAEFGLGIEVEVELRSYFFLTDLNFSCDSVYD